VRALLTAAFLLTTLLFTAHEATAAPPTAADPPDILTPADPPEPQPCRKVGPVPCDVTFPTLTVDVPTTPSEPASEPSTPSVTTPAEETSSTPAPGDDTAGGDDTAAGPARTTSPVSPPAPAGTDWWLITIPVLALLALAAAGTVLLIQRSERRPR
jgi:hypothetical protein